MKKRWCEIGRKTCLVVALLLSLLQVDAVRLLQAHEAEESEFSLSNAVNLADVAPSDGILLLPPSSCAATAQRSNFDVSSHKSKLELLAHR